MDNKNLLVSVGVGVIAVILSVFLGGSETVKEITHEVVKTQPTGAVSNPDIASPYFAYGGVRHWASRMAMYSASTTVCAMQSPASTSTLQGITVKEDVSSSSASVITIAKATTAFATTTIIGNQITVAANGQTFIEASSTQGLAGALGVFAPNTWVVVGQQGGLGTFSPTGSCQARWIEHPSF